MDYPGKERLKKIFLSEPNAHRFALSCAVGTFIAFSPYLGIQTVLIFLLSWLMGLNTIVLFTITYVINNPWTMIPIVVLDYFVGDWIARYLLHVDLSRYNPEFMNSLNAWLARKLGPYLVSFHLKDLSFWSYFLGGHVVALLAACVAYPLSKGLFKRFVGQKMTSKDSV